MDYAPTTEQTWESIDAKAAGFNADKLAAAIAFVRYHLDINSTQLMERLAKDKRVLVIPGDHFNTDHFVRISFGLSANYLTPGLDRFHDLLGEMAQRKYSIWNR